MKRGSYAGAWIEARALLHRHRRELAAGLALVLVNRLAALALPVSSKYAIDEVVGKGHGDLLLPIAGAAATGVMLQAATSFAVAHRTGIAAERAVAHLRQELYTHVLRLPVRTFDVTPTGTFVSRLMTDAEQIRTVLGPGLVQLASSVLTAGLALGVLMTLNAPLTLSLAALLTLFVAGLTRVFGWFRGTYLQMSIGQADLTGRLTELLAGIRVVKAFSAERAESYRLTGAAHGVARLGIRAANGLALLHAGLTVLPGLTSVMLLIVLVQHVLAGTMTLGDLALYVLLVGLLVTPLAQTASLGAEIGRAASALHRVHELRVMSDEVTRDAQRRSLPHLRGDLAFDDVSYAYQTGHYAIHNVSFAAEAGSCVALAGRSGSGKSTICRLLLAFDEPTLGRVLVDGQDVSVFRRAAYRAHASAVLQDNVLFDGSIADNIRYGRPRATQAELRAAARLAHCEEFISRLPQGYETRVGERGVWLSGGQRQRLAIARALLADPRILVLDEATSELDIESEALVQDALRALRQGRTTFMVAHKATVLRSADQVLVLDAGRIVDQGAPQDVLGRMAYLVPSDAASAAVADEYERREAPNVA